MEVIEHHWSGIPSSSLFHQEIFKLPKLLYSEKQNVKPAQVVPLLYERDIYHFLVNIPVSSVWLMKHLIYSCFQTLFTISGLQMTNICIYIILTAGYFW